MLPIVLGEANNQGHASLPALSKAISCAFSHVCDCVCSVERGHAMVDVQKWLRRHCSDYYHFYCEAFLEQVITNLLKCLNS